MDADRSQVIYNYKMIGANALVNDMGGSGNIKQQIIMSLRPLYSFLYADVDKSVWA